MCHTKAPHFSAFATPKDFYFFNLGRSKRPPFQKYTILCSAFLTWADRKDPSFKNIYVSLLFLAPKSPVFPVRGHSESLPFSVRGHFLSPQFLNPVRHIYTNIIFEYPPPPTPPPPSHCGLVSHLIFSIFHMVCKFCHGLQVLPYFIPFSIQSHTVTHIPLNAAPVAEWLRPL